MASPENSCGAETSAHAAPVLEIQRVRLERSSPAKRDTITARVGLVGGSAGVSIDYAWSVAGVPHAASGEVLRLVRGEVGDTVR